MQEVYARPAITACCVVARYRRDSTGAVMALCCRRSQMDIEVFGTCGIFIIGILIGWCLCEIKRDLESGDD